MFKYSRNQCIIFKKGYIVRVRIISRFFSFNSSVRFDPSVVLRVNFPSKHPQNQSFVPAIWKSLNEQTCRMHNPANSDKFEFGSIWLKILKVLIFSVLCSARSIFFRRNPAILDPSSRQS
jgi:hypothetical protein